LKDRRIHTTHEPVRIYLCRTYKEIEHVTVSVLPGPGLELGPEPEPIFGPGADSGTEFITEFISISELNTIECMKKSEPEPES
jgi:hypothetical protein